MRTELELCNMALRHISQNKITLLTGTDPSSVICADFFDQCRDDLFREFAWPFATAQETLISCATTVSIPLGWDYAYAYPDNVATIWKVFNEGTYDKKESQDFEIMYDRTSGNKIICTNIDEAYAEMTYIVEDTTEWDAKFDLMFSFKLAAIICPGLTGDVEKALKLTEIYNGLLQETKRIAASEKSKFPERTSPTIDAR